MDKKQLTLIGAVTAVLVFLLQWIAGDILDNQTYFSPHEVVNELLGTNTEASTASDTVYVPVGDDNYVVYTISVSSANVRKGAGTSYDVLTTAKQNQTFAGTGNVQTTSSGAKWYEIYLNDSGQLGWISEKVCNVTEKIQVAQNPSVPVETEATEQPSATEQPAESIEPSEAVSTEADNGDKVILGRMSDAELENKLPTLVQQDNRDYATEWYIIKKIIHIVILIVVIFIILIIAFLSLGTEKKFLSVVFLAAAIALVVISIVGTTKYKYKYEEKYLIESVESTDGVYNIVYRDGTELMQMQIDSSRTQLLQAGDSDSSVYIYKFEKKTKNLFYYVTEMKPQERTIFLIY